MTNNGVCPLCGADETKLVQRLRVSDLAAAYRRKLNLEIEIRVDAVEYRECGECALLFFSPAITGSERFYAELQRRPWYYPIGKHEFAIAQGFVRPSDSLLEVGAGAGHFASAITVREYVGLELGEATLGEALRRGIGLRAETIESHSMRSPSRYDVVCSFQVLEHVAHPRSFLEAAVRTLRDEGLLIIGVPGEDSFAAQDYWQVLNMPPHHVTRWRDRCLRNMATILGVDLVGIFPEELAESDLMAYGVALANASYAKRSNRKMLMLDARLARPFAKFRARRLAKLLSHGLKVPGLRPRGQAVVAVYRKSATRLPVGAVGNHRNRSEVASGDSV